MLIPVRCPLSRARSNRMALDALRITPDSSVVVCGVSHAQQVVGPSNPGNLPPVTGVERHLPRAHSGSRRLRFGVVSIAQPSGGRPEAASEATTGCPADPHQSVASAGESSHGGAGPARAPAACSAGPSDAALPLLVRTGRTLATWTPAACQLEKPREAARGEVFGA